MRRATERDIYAALRRDHHEVAALFDQLTEARHAQDWARTGDLFVALAETLVAHARAEQQVVYPRLARGTQSELTAVLEEQRAEHERIEALIEVLGDRALTDAAFAEGLAELRDLVERHRQADEAELFPLAASQIDELEAARLARAFDTRKRDLLALELELDEPVVELDDEDLMEISARFDLSDLHAQA